MSDESGEAADPQSDTEASDALLTARQKIVRWALWGVNNEPRVHYSNRRPIDGLRNPGKLPLHTDCSGFVTDCYAWSNAPDPNGNRFSGAGYTGTLLAHCRRITEAQLLPGDLVVFGPGTGTHVVVMVGTGAAGDVVSHGNEGAPDRYSLRRAKTYFPGPVRPLRCPRLGALAIGDDEPDESGAPGLEPGVEVDPDGSNPAPGEPEGT